MRSRALRTTCGAIAWIAVGLAAFFLFRSEKQITELGAAVRAFDLHAREVSTSLDDLRAGQQNYDATEGAIRTQQALAIGGAAALCAIVVLMLIPAGRPELEFVEEPQSSGAAETIPIPQAPPSSTIGTILRTTADLATDF